MEKKLGLSEQPRAIVFHEKNTRRHCHVVWSRINTKEMKAIPLPFTKLKLMDISRELYRENNWQMPEGLMDYKNRNPLNFTLAQWQQAKRLGKNPKTIKADFQECWAASDNQEMFQQALKERGYILAKGDRRGFVALDYRCEVFSIAKWAGIKAKDVRVKLTDNKGLPSVDEAKEQISQNMTVHLDKLKKEQYTAINSRIAEIEKSIIQMCKQHELERKSLLQKQFKRRSEETKIRQGRFNKGLLGIIDLLTGKRKNIKTQNEQETLEAKKRDAQEMDTLIFKQQELRQKLQERIKRLENLHQMRKQRLSDDMSQYHEVSDGKRKFAKFERNFSRQHSPSLER